MSILIHVPKSSPNFNRQSTYAKRLKEKAIEGSIVENDNLDTLASKVRAIAKFNSGNINVIQRRLTSRIVAGYNYTITADLKNSLEGDQQLLEIERMPVRDSVGACINGWKYTGEPLEIPDDIFNDHIDYTLERYQDVVRLNSVLPKIAKKYAESLPDRSESYRFLIPHLNNMKKIKVAVMELKTLTVDFDDDDIVFEMKTNIKKLISGLGKVSDELPSTQMVMSASDYVGFFSTPCDRATRMQLTEITKKASMSGHTSWIRDTLYYQIDRKAYMASCSDDCTVKLWNLTDNEVVATLRDHDSYIFSLTKFDLNDTPCLASGSNDHTIKVWNLRTQKLIMTLNGHASYVRSLVSYYVGGKPYIVSGSADNTLKIWKPATQSLVATLEGHTSFVLTLAQYTDANGVPCVASGGYDAKVKLWDLETRELITSLPGHNNYIWKLVAFETSYGSFLASGDADGAIRLWNLKNNSFTTTLSGHDGLVYGLTAFTRKGKTFLASGDSKGIVKFWDPFNHELVNTYQGTFTAVNSLSTFYRKSKPYLTVGHCQNIELWS
mmetsp:Transcript_12954/g.16350  ORF Transcript_12954/g.16350 Transcript_12954/m.16350 type:complete len:552 (+) Transcript_12954:224-1879(+)